DAVEGRALAGVLFEDAEEAFDDAAFVIVGRLRIVGGALLLAEGEGPGTRQRQVGGQRQGGEKQPGPTYAPAPHGGSSVAGSSHRPWNASDSLSNVQGVRVAGRGAFVNQLAMLRPLGPLGDQPFAATGLLAGSGHLWYIHRIGKQCRYLLESRPRVSER